jgi:aspartate racemase
MKTIGLIGGISWPSTVEYYKAINQKVNARLGGVHAGKMIIQSVDFHEVKTLTFENDWDGLAQLISAIGQNLQHAGAECILITANTMHKIADKVQSAIDVPLVHIAVETAQVIQTTGLQKVALLGTRYTMEDGFFSDVLLGYEIETIIPPDQDRGFVHDVIYEELGKGIFRESTKRRLQSIITDLAQQGAQGVILGCTEIPLVIKQEDSPIPIFDTVDIHANAAVKFALS